MPNRHMAYFGSELICFTKKVFLLAAVAKCLLNVGIVGSRPALYGELLHQS